MRVLKPKQIIPQYINLHSDPEDYSLKNTEYLNLNKNKWPYSNKKIRKFNSNYAKFLSYTSQIGLNINQKEF